MQKLTILALLAFLAVAPGTISPEEAEPDEILLEDFRPEVVDSSKEVEPYKDGLFPDDWKYRNSKVKQIYVVMKENDSYYLKARSAGFGIQTFKKIGINFKKYPYFSWKWRVVKFPAEDKVTDKLKSDDGACVYVIFSGFLSRTALKYIWSSYYPAGTVIDKGPRMQVIVLRDKTGKKGVWTLEERNVFEDYRKYFEKDPSSTVGFAVMSDSDDTESYVEADYSDFYVRKSPSVLQPDLKKEATIQKKSPLGIEEPLSH